MKKNPQRRQDFIKFIFIALVLTFCIRGLELFNFYNKNTPQKDSAAQINTDHSHNQMNQLDAIVSAEANKLSDISPASGAKEADLRNLPFTPMPKSIREKFVRGEPFLSLFETQEKQKTFEAVPPAHHGERVKIAIIIDDVGMSGKWSRAAINLPAPITLAFLPYAENLDAITSLAQSRGHELIIHVPMEPLNKDLDLGPIALKTNMDQQRFSDVLKQDVFPAFDGYVGVNNHMGSKLTQNSEAMAWLMDHLKERNLFFVDSKTIHTSLAAKTALKKGVAFAERDVFLDHVDTPEAVLASLRKLEQTAYNKGYAIAIGHPKRNTIEALQTWLPELASKGIELVEVSELLTMPKEIKAPPKLSQKNSTGVVEHILQ